MERQHIVKVDVLSFSMKRLKLEEGRDTTEQNGKENIYWQVTTGWMKLIKNSLLKRKNELKSHTNEEEFDTFIQRKREERDRMYVIR